MIYELATLSGGPLALASLADAALNWMKGDMNGGQLLGLWQSDIGPIGEVIALRSFTDLVALQKERERALTSNDPMGCRKLDARLTMESYAGFPFLPDVTPGPRGGIYEIRTYHLRPGGLPPTLRGWQQALGPARDYTDHLVTNMYALDGAPRITHIWGFSSLEERAALRAKHYAQGTWPPPGGPGEIDHALSRIVLPAEGSCLL